MRQARQLTSHNLIADLLHAQAHILETHCTNDSKLCMQGPKGETGPKGDPGIPGKAKDPECSCLISPAVRGDGSQHYLSGGRPVVLHCLTAGNPDPYVTWTKDGVRISTITNQNLTVTTPGNYTCTAENIVGVATLTFHVT
ncbi:leucine-rich repeat neuronal protein 2-like [Pecten maximus]|uniref:leucine-rich repeat neuronal protein 2-like n=1 Tax=Pecten maximus TaxID=6579 RepID=UPI0014583650|nr:leucine-rich repeat neuronal protein 2-like [Pecten maximus]XP_033724991.1 leucine-rich repeat neuronal protein 2-like [Pecten maximus]